MNVFSIMLKGFLIGVAKIIPGISGSVLALSLGVYDKVLNIISRIKNISLKDIYYLFCLTIGVLFGITFFAGVVKFLISHYFLLTMALFVGMIAGGIPSLVKETKFNLQNVCLFFSSFFIIVLIESLGSGSGDIKVNAQLYLNMGITEAFTTLIPGISGTAIFMALGWYETLLDLFTGTGLFKTEILYLLLFIGSFIIFGVIIMKVINYFLSRWRCATYSVILGFMIGSLYLILKNITSLKICVSEGIMSCILFVAGLYINKITKHLD